MVLTVLIYNDDDDDNNSNNYNNVVYAYESARNTQMHTHTHTPSVHFAEDAMRLAATDRR